MFVLCCRLTLLTRTCFQVNTTSVNHRSRAVQRITAKHEPLLLYKHSNSRKMESVFCALWYTVTFWNVKYDSWSAWMSVSEQAVTEKHTFCKIFTLQLREKCRINEIIADVTVMPLCCNDAIEFSCHSSHLRLSLERCYNVAGGDIYGVALKVLRVLCMCIPFSLALFFSWRLLVPLMLTGNEGGII